MKFTTREIFGIFLILIVGLLALVAWQSFFTVMVVPGVSDIWQPVLWFSLLAIFFFVGTAVWTKKGSRAAASMLVFFPGIFFLPTWEFIAASVLSAVFVFGSAMMIAEDFTERLHFRFLRSVRIGSFFFVLGLSLALSSGYYVFLKSASWEELVPRFRIGEEMTQVIFKVAGVVNPSFADLSEGDATVDEFLLSLEQDKKEKDPSIFTESEEPFVEENVSDIPPEMIRYLETRGIMLSPDGSRQQIEQGLFLRSGREQIATLVGGPMRGDEKISEVLSLALQKKLIVFLQGEKATTHVPSQAVPFFLSLLLFFTLLSLISILNFLCIFGAHLLFLASLRIGWLKLETITVEKHKLAE